MLVPNTILIESLSQDLKNLPQKWAAGSRGSNHSTKAEDIRGGKAAQQLGKEA